MFLRRCVGGGVLRDRYRRRSGSTRDLQELRKMAILEAESEKRMHERACASGPPVTALRSSSFSLGEKDGGNQATAVQLLDDAMERARVHFSHFISCPAKAALSSSLYFSSSSSSVRKATSLTHFLTECRRLRQAIGESRDVSNRRSLRQELRSFWTENIDGALACCAMHGRDFGFVAGFGLFDDALHVCFSSLQLALHSVASEKSTCACIDMVLALHYMARELYFMEKKQKETTSVKHLRHRKRKVKAEVGVEADVGCVDDGGGGGGAHSAAEMGGEAGLKEFRRAIATVGVERVNYFFLQRGSSSGRVLGSAEDALHALEFLAVVKVGDADESTRVLIEKNTPKWCTSGDSYIVTSLFQHLVRNSKDLKFTSVVHAFKLLRIFLPVICLSPPSTRLWQRKGTEKDCGDTHVFVTNNFQSSSASHAEAGDVRDLSNGYPHLGDWQRQRDIVDGVVWGLLAALQRKDTLFVNSFHFVQIIVTLSRLPPHILSSPRRPRRKPMQSLYIDIKKSEHESRTSPGSQTAIMRSGSGEGESLQSVEEMWEYIVSKACVFIPNLASDSRRHVCRSLWSAIHKREKFLNRVTHVDEKRSSKLTAAYGLLLPMMRELAQYPMDYQAVMLDCQWKDEKIS